MATAMADPSRTVAYYYDEEIGSFNYGGGNPMRPHRVRLTHSLVENYDLPKLLKVHRPTPRTETELEEFHADDYVSFLQRVTPDGQDEFLAQMRRFNLGPVGEADCPVFDGMFEYCALYSGGSVGGAALLNKGGADVCLNWAGGMHHAKKAEASGFCYVNDIVLAILELLKTHARVLYVDIDIHHGDGVEEAFYLTDRVMTVSFHKYGDFFPGTGALGDVGTAGGAGYSVNVPLQEGMDDESYRFVFEPIMAKVMEVFQPGAIVVCGGADSLSGDRLGCFNLSLDGHASAIDFLARFRVPMLVLGGGGYTMRNVARCWAYETGRLLGLDLPDDLPAGALAEYDYYVDTHRLRIAVSNMRNANTREGLAAITRTVLANLSKLPPVPSVPFTVPPPAAGGGEVAQEPDPDVRGGGQAADDARASKADDGYGSDAEAGARDVSAAAAPAAAAAAAAVPGPPSAVKAEGGGSGGGEDVKVEAVAPPAPGPAGADEAYLRGGGGAGPAPMEVGGGGGEAAAPAPAAPAAAPPAAAAPDANGTAPGGGEAAPKAEEGPGDGGGGEAPMAT